MAFLVQEKIQAQNTSCGGSQFICNDTSFSYNYEEGDDCLFSPLYLWFHFQVPDTMTSVIVTSPGNMLGYTLWGPIDSLGASCDVAGDTSSPVLNSSVSTMGSYTLNNGSILPPGYYYLRVSMADCSSSISFETNGGNLECMQIPCENCIGSFAPEPGKKYLISVWVQEKNAPPTKTSYTKPGVSIAFTGSVITYGSFRATGEIIDGWQRVEEEFIVPAGATGIQLTLECDSSDCYFDDLRIYPFEGSIKTYVYDPLTLRLVAELDERNYATIYEYDEEGKLLRVKKETERGVMTIQESKTSINKR